MSIASILAHAGCPDEKIADALRLVPYNHDRQHELTEQYLARTISKVQADTRALPSAPVQKRIVRMSLTETKLSIAKWLAFSRGEDLAIDVALAAKLANDAPGDPVFVVLVGPSSGAKSEIIRAFKDVPGVYSLGSLTARTFASGLDPKKASLLSRLPEDVHTLALKDLGTILAMNPNERGELLQQLRDICDGSFRREWGSGKPALDWKGRLGLLAGATPAIEREFSTLAALGERFLFFRMRIANRKLQAKRALEGCGHEGQMREEIHHVIASVLVGISPNLVASIKVASESADKLQAIALALTKARTPLVRNRYDKTIEFLPVAEGPARAVKALKKLGQALAILYDHDLVGTPELAVLARIGADSIPSARSRCLAWLFRQYSNKWHTSKTVGQAVQLPTTTTTRVLEDLAVLGVVDRVAVNGAENATFEARLKLSFRGLLRRSGLVAAIEHAYPPESEVERGGEEGQVSSSADSEGWPQRADAGRDKDVSA
jgi:hypothetical protein